MRKRARKRQDKVRHTQILLSPRKGGRGMLHVQNRDAQQNPICAHNFEGGTAMLHSSVQQLEALRSFYVKVLRAKCGDDICDLTQMLWALLSTP